MNASISSMALILAVTSCTPAKAARQETALQARVQPEVVLTGCVVQGASPTAFVFDNAKKDPSAPEKGERYLLTSTVETIDLRTHINHAVRITGEVDLRISAMPSRDATDERTLPRLIVKSVTMVSDKCPSGK